MRLQEIFNTEKSDQRWTDQLQALINKHGLQKFSGLQATVITTPDREHVYRVWVKDDGYEAWMNLALTMQDNPHIVKILGKPRIIPTKFKGLPSDLKVKFVKLEKLDSLMKIKGKDGQTLEDAILKYGDPDYTPVDPAATEAFMKEHESFFKTCDEVKKHLRANDFTTENIMLRGTTLVITDPVSD